ncbi:MAG: hypothetical protein DME44_07805 [Verrucomicrobia bacterium]|nr:MAG: hypothetical protein DME44_07805 [Verrucomicrobiota bacterium]
MTTVRLGIIRILQSNKGRPTAQTGFDDSLEDKHRPCFRCYFRERSILRAPICMRKVSVT